MPRIGLTGGIGSGKSTVARIFEVLGAPVYYADEAAKRIMNTDPGLREAIIKHFGKEAYSSGTLDRRWIASIVFSNPDKLALLNSLTHPATIADANSWMKKQKAPYTIKEAALIFESGANEHLDHIIGVSAPIELRIERTMNRDKVTREEVLKRMQRQMDEEEKMKRCDYIIINDEKKAIIPQVLELHKKLIAIK